MKTEQLIAFLLLLVFGAQAQAERMAPGTPGEVQPSVNSTLERFDEAGLQQLHGLSTPIPKIRNPYGARSSRACVASWKDIEKKRPKSVNPPSQARVESLIRKVIGAGASEKYAKRALASFIANQKSIPNQKTVSFIDFTKRSSEKRMVIMNIETMSVETFHVAAGKGSDVNGDGRATRFSNTGGSNASSLGCALVNTRFNDNKGRPSLFIHGYESTNDKSCDRDVIMHPAGYVGGTPARSWGCPAVRPQDRQKVYDRLDGGTLLCSYFEGSDTEGSSRPKKKGTRNGRRRA